MKTYTVKTASYLQEAHKFMYEMRTSDGNVKRTQNKYYKMCKKREVYDLDIEKAIQDHEKGTITFAQVQRRSNQTFDIKKQTELSYHEYIGELEDFNKLVDDSQVLYKDWLNKLQDQDEQRIDATKTCLKKFFNTFADLGELVSEKISESISSVDLMNPQTDTRVFIDENRSKEEFYKKKEFVSFDYSKKIIKNRQERLNSRESLEDFVDVGRSQSLDTNPSRNSLGISSSKTFDGTSKQEEHDLLGLGSIEDTTEERKETESFNSNKGFVKHAIEGLFKGKALTKEDQLKVFELIHEDYIDTVLSNHLNSIKTPRRLESVEILKSLAEIIKYLITVSIHDKHNDFNIVISVLGCSQNVYAIDQKSMRKILLTHLIRNHGIWQDISKWILWIYKVIEDKRQEYNERRKSITNYTSGEEPTKKVGSRLMGGIKGFGRFMLGKGNNDDDMKNDVITKNLIFNVLSQFVYHFANFGVSLEGGK